MNELKYQKDHALKLLEECTDLDQIRLIRALLMDSTTLKMGDDTAQESELIQNT